MNICQNQTKKSLNKKCKKDDFGIILKLSFFNSADFMFNIIFNIVFLFRYIYF